MRFSLYASPLGHVFIVSAETNADGRRFSFASQRINGPQGRQNLNNRRVNDGSIEMAELGYQLAGEFTLSDLDSIGELKRLHDKCATLMCLLDIFVAEDPTLEPAEELNRVLLIAAGIIRSGRRELPEVDLFRSPQPNSRYQWESP